MRSIRAVVSAHFVCLLTVGLVQVQSGWKVSKTLCVGGESGWDYLTVDPENHRLFVTRTTHSMILEADSGKPLGDVPGQKI